MKVDVVVNSMIQQIDRNLQMQQMPALSFRAGEILRGRVMLTSDNRLQIRLDSGALLNALPAGDAVLLQGATVTLRVTGQTDGNIVMQLLTQEPGGQAGQASAAEARLPGLNATPLGRAVLQSMQRMNIPLGEETAQRAMEILGRFPELAPERAVFMAANRMAATKAQVDALNRLIDQRATTGGELLKLADMLSSRAMDRENIALMEDGGRALGEAPQAAAGRLDDTPAQAGPPAQTAAPEAQPKFPAGGDGMLRLQSLALIALGADAAERYSGVVASLAARGALESAVSLALDGPFLSAKQFSEELNRFTAALPQDEASPARAFLAKLTAGIARYVERNGAEAALPQQASPEGGLQRVVRDIMQLFVRLDAPREDGPGAGLMRSAAEQSPALSHIASDVGRSGTAGPDVARQLDGLANHVRLLGDISQYVCQQLPVSVNGRNSTVELYVLNRGKRGKKINPENANMLIALDTEHMGRVEALVNIAKKNLRVRFGVESPELVGLVGAQSAALGKALQEIGYRLSDMRTQVISRPVNPLTVSEAVEPAVPAGSLDVKV